MTRRAAFFDMDRTLVRVNTGSLYARWRFQRREAGLRDMARVARWMALYTFGAIDAEAVSRRALESVAGMSEEEFRHQLADWYRAAVRPHVTRFARDEVERRRRAGDTLVILSASTPYVVGPLAADLGIEHALCSELEIDGGVFTGRCVDLCYGPHKVRFAERWAEEHGVDLAHSAFYTDSVSDLPMLQRVGEARVINPDPRLRVLARRHGWRVETWR
ncbi:MAG: HAD-IB family hydrolase [Sandaracinus sp.]|nr:HAD-IB family hydrolase [Sandaracinus sp.]|tara:strand:+ start:1121 stop:1774 length:654 start_codon:yes stop_codon:yes gene_type:complete